MEGGYIRHRERAIDSMCARTRPVSRSGIGDHVRGHQSNPGYDQERRLVDRLRRVQASVPSRLGDPLREISWEVVRDVVGLQVAVIVHETAQVVVKFARDAVRVQPVEIAGQLGRLPRPPPRDAFDPVPPPG